MLKYLTHELDKDDRDYRRFFQSRNVSLSSFSKFRNLNNDKRVSGRKNKILSKKITSRIKVTMVHGSKDEVVPVYFSRKVLSIFPFAKKKLLIIKGGDHSLSNKKPLRRISKELDVIVKNVI